MHVWSLVCWALGVLGLRVVGLESSGVLARVFFCCCCCSLLGSRFMALGVWGLSFLKGLLFFCALGVWSLGGSGFWGLAAWTLLKFRGS